jgi:hypothetical protein
MGSYSPFADEKEPCGFCLQGFYEEYELCKEGTVDYHQDFLPLFTQFLASFPRQLPSWTEWVNAYRHFIGLSYNYPQTPYQGVIVEGFRFDFDLYYDPCWLAHNDLDLNIPHMPLLSNESLFWMAHQAWYKGLQEQGCSRIEDLTRSWHRFLEVSAVCLNSSALVGSYKDVGVSSFEEVHRHYFPDEDFREHYAARLREFAEEMIMEHGFFLPSHHFEAWLAAIEEDYADYCTLLNS